MRVVRTPLTVFSYVGNLGCIRFPQTVRSAAKVKRGDRLALSIQADESILLEKLPVSLSAAELEIEGCACEGKVPAGCALAGVLTVGWSYVQLDQSMATRLGFLPERPIKLTAQPSQISVALHRGRRDLAGVEKVACPP